MKRVPHADHVRIARCPCGDDECQIVFMTLFDAREKPIARFGFAIDYWPQFLADTAVEVRTMTGAPTTH